MDAVSAPYAEDAHVLACFRFHEGEGIGRERREGRFGIAIADHTRSGRGIDYAVSSAGNQHDMPVAGPTTGEDAAGDDVWRGRPWRGRRTRRQSARLSEQRLLEGGEGG